MKKEKKSGGIMTEVELNSPLNIERILVFYKDGITIRSLEGDNARKYFTRLDLVCRLTQSTPNMPRGIFDAPGWEVASGKHISALLRKFSGNKHDK